MQHKDHKQVMPCGNIVKILSSAALLALFGLGFVQAEEQQQGFFEEVLIVGNSEQRENMAGSAYLVDSDDLATYDYTDLNRVLSQVPGLYIRTEDGFGLRPNIGIRGATSDRSQKITLMEDRILIAPAPYSAPAAYYIPNVNRMSAVEVVKGPATTNYGPHTVGGAINFVTPFTPEDRIGEAELSLGSYGFQKQRALYGDKHGSVSYWIEGLRYASDGFKTLDNGGDTGFERHDLNAKIRWQGESRFNPSLELKLGYAEEDSNETYLGLTDTDFASDPNRRYVASELDNFTSEHQQAHLIYSMDIQPNLNLSARAYVNKFDRAWYRFNGFIGNEDTDLNYSVAASDVLGNPDVFFREIAIIRGETDSDGTLDETLSFANNDRSYGSDGLQIDLGYQLETGEIAHSFDLGVRYHRDYVDRLHDRFGFLMTDGQLITDGIIYSPTTDNRAETTAIALNLSDQITYKNLQVTLGARLENIDASQNDYLDNEITEREDRIMTPSLGATYEIGEAWTLLAGIYQGFSPTGAAASEEVDPEETTNIEYGFRYNQNNLSVDLIGFFSDYENLIGRCRASDTGCEVGEEFNGGEVEVSGLELLARYHIDFDAVSIPLTLSLTRTDTAFQQRFESGFSQWGTVQSGDELPYVPNTFARMETGIVADNWSVNLSATYSGEMRELPGQGEIPDDELIEAFWVVDISTQYQLNDQWNLMLAADNLLDEQEIASRRPFGARPTKPQSINATVVYQF